MIFSLQSACTKRSRSAVLLLMLLGSILMGQGTATLVVTGSVHGQLDPCG